MEHKPNIYFFNIDGTVIEIHSKDGEIPIVCKCFDDGALKPVADVFADCGCDRDFTAVRACTEYNGCTNKHQLETSKRICRNGL